EDAFLRRLKNKIKIEPLQDGLFRDLLRRVASAKGIPCSPEMEDLIVHECRQHSPGGLRACFPSDLMAIIAGMARFEQRSPALDKDQVEQAMKLYFAH